jgi:hypothetical protein
MMLGLFSSLLMVGLSGAPCPVDPATVHDAGMQLALAQAEQDFAKRHEELGLVGSAPLFGLNPEPPSAPALRERKHSARKSAAAGHKVDSNRRTRSARSF